MLDFNSPSIEVQSFGIVAEEIQSVDLEWIGDHGYDLTNSWRLAAEEHGENMKYYIFSRPE